MASGGSQTLALFGDGALYQWRNYHLNPERIDGFGVLAGRRVVAIASGDVHSLALCDDGTLAVWGGNSYGQFGTGSFTGSVLPVAVDRSGVLAGKRVTSIAAGSRHSVVACSDGTLAAWGFNFFGQLGNGTTTDSRVPVSVSLAGIPSGRKIETLGAGVNHSLALLDDGTMLGWGNNQNGQLGDGTILSRSTPVAVNRSGVLAGKSITALAVGGNHNAALCSDGTLATWGYNYQGRLGDGTSTDRSTPVAIQAKGALAGKSVVGIALGLNHSLAGCSDGSVASWGSNEFLALGNNTSSPSSIPTLVDTTAIAAGESISSWVTGSTSSSSLLHLAAAPGPVANTLAASEIQDSSATLNSEVITNRNLTRVTFEYGLTADYGEKFVVQPDVDADTAGQVPVTATIDELLSGTTYHFRVVVTGPFGTTLGEDRTFTTTTRGALAGLHLSSGSIIPAFNGAVTGYRGTVPFAADQIRITPIAATGEPLITVNGAAVPSGSQSNGIPLEPGLNRIEVRVVAADGINRKTYTLLLRRLPEAFAFHSPTEIPLTVESFTAVGDAPPVSLGHEPRPGTVLTLVHVTGNDLIEGTFANLAQGQIVPLTFGNTTYHFAADYGGGSGNDLVLHWAATRTMAWGSNFTGQLGNGTNTASLLPTPVSSAGVLAGQTIVGLSAAMTSFSEYGFSAALTADGRVATWGSNDRGQLGNGTTTDTNLPGWVDTTGVLAGKTVIDVATGAGHGLALCSDGTMVAWGYNALTGQLGDGSNINRPSPVAVRLTGPLTGKKVAAIAAGSYVSLALFTDGTLATWGSSSILGDGSTAHRALPGPVDQSGVLAGKKVIAIAAGGSIGMALCDDGTLATWGYNGEGALGDGTKINATVPVLVDRSGVLAGKTIVQIAAGDRHTMALCSDGSLAAWGNNTWGQLGNGGTAQSSVPVLVDTGGVLAGKSITAISSARLGGLALCSDGTLAAWGQNDFGQLGDNSKTQRLLPTLVNTATLFPGDTFVIGASGSSSGSHALGAVASPLPTAAVLAASEIGGTSAMLNGVVNPLGNAVTVAIEYGRDETYGNSVIATPAPPANGAPALVTATITGLPPGTLHHYRIVATGGAGIVRSSSMTFTTLSDNAKLASLTSVGAFLSPQFQPEGSHYLTSVDFTRSLYQLRPSTQHPGARVTVNGIPVASGSIGQALPLAVGNNLITLVVTAEDGITTRTYTNTVTRLPELFELTASGQAPVSAEGFAIGAQQFANLRLRYHPPTGSSLTLVENTGLTPIERNFGNIAHGQRFTLRHDGVDYAWVANYFGGTGNDLVLHWADTRITSWGLNNYGQLGDGSTTVRNTPVAVDDSGLLAGKTVFTVSGGYLHTLALCADGTLAAWGYNVHGQLGNNLTTASATPVAVDSSGALAGKTVVAVSAGPYHNLALCSDGTLVAWGYNNYGQLGTGDTQTRRTPVLVPPLGALAGKRVTAISAGAYHSLALCSDGTVVGWGYNDEGELGDGTTARRMVPVAADPSGALAGKKVAMIRGGQYHSLALCTDGSVVSWGYNPRGQLGDGSTANRLSPVDISGSGGLGGRTVIDLATGGSHSLALCSDGTVAAWGYNHRGQLGRSGGGQSPLPLPVAIAPAASRIAAGAFHSLTLDADGAIGAWGDHANGQLGSPLSPPAGQAATPDTLAIHPGSRAIAISTGSGASHSLALIALPLSGAPPNQDASSSAGNDSIPALLRYAFGLDPEESDPSRLPRPRLENGRLVARFARPAGVTGIIYGAEWSTTLQPGSWQDIPNTGTADAPEFITPESGAPSLFMRLKVSDEPVPAP